MKTILTAEFNLDWADIEYLSKLPEMDKKTRDSFRIIMNGYAYKLYKFPNLIIFPPQNQKVKLELERCEKV